MATLNGRKETSAAARRAYYPYKPLPVPKDQASSIKKRKSRGARTSQAAAQVQAEEGSVDEADRDEDLEQEEQAENDVLETFQVASARELWNCFNAQPGSFNEHMGDEEVLSVLAEGQLQSQGGGEIPQMSSSELRRAAMQAVQCSRPVDQTAAYAKWIAKGASGTKGKVTTEEVPSLQQRDYKKRTID
ncbi:hypothetical protein Slin14017_G022010 [Septoria linicola]|nr:hypothetical protein Slin14017_G022010 [Septoria linicola]